MTVDPDWAATINQNGSASLYGAMVAVDDVGYIYVAGSYPWSTIITAKFDQLGNRIWQREFDNLGTREQGSWIAIHPTGGVVVAGYTLCCDNSDSNTTGYVTVRYACITSRAPFPSDETKATDYGCNIDREKQCHPCGGL